MDKKMYDIEYLKNNLNTSICFEFQNSFATIGVIDQSVNQDKCVKFCIALDENFDEMQFLYFDTLDELFETVSIEGNLLKDIWNDVKITDIS